ncbi:MAG TPA: cytochrome c oxidase assembly protein [Verrucomicrobiae bacterium]|nr:cytochrome c oxidase assembly protein [Verrucomicrobiae bacterium]
MLRTASLLLGLLVIGVAMASPVAALDHRMLTAHMVQHLLLMTIAPPLVFLGAAPQFRRLAPQPAICWLAATAVLVGWHIPAAFRFGMQSGLWHAIEQLSFLAAGLLFWWPVFELPRRWSILLYLFLATLPCDVLSGFLVFSDRIAYPAYLCIPRHAGWSALADQQCAGALMWTVVTIVYLIAGTVFATQLLAAQRAGAA